MSARHNMTPGQINMCDALATEHGRSAAMWAWDQPECDRYGYRAEALGYRVDTVVAFLERFCPTHVERLPVEANPQAVTDDLIRYHVERLKSEWKRSGGAA